MKLILGGINGKYLGNITLNSAQQTEQVWAAVAYASDASLLFDWCWNNKIPLKYWGKLDESVPVTVPILTQFLKRRSPNFICKLVQHHHAKVIWWRGVGLYIGSANLSGKAWYQNVEAGCFFSEEKIDDEMAVEVSAMFDRLDSHSTPLTEELLNVMIERAKLLKATEPNNEKFWASASIKKWSGLVQTSMEKEAKKRQRKAFLEEWHSTIQHLRDIGSKVSEDEFRPRWVNRSTPLGAQADQFLHAHYYQDTFDGRKADYERFYELNKNDVNNALTNAMRKWGDRLAAPNFEDLMLNEKAPYLQKALTHEALNSMTLADFEGICERVHAITDYARRVPNKAVSLPDNGKAYSIPTKVKALSRQIWQSRTNSGLRVEQVNSHILYGGTDDQLAERLWDAMADPKWKIERLGVSALGEIVGWALPDRFPPRNGRTSKALRSLGYDVSLHV